MRFRRKPDAGVVPHRPFETAAHIATPSPTEKDTVRTQTCYVARIYLLSQSDRSVIHRFAVLSTDKGAFFNIGLGEKQGQDVKRGTKDIMLIGIDGTRGEVFLLDWLGNKVTLRDNDPAPIGSGKFRLCIREIVGKEVEPFDRHPPRSAEEVAFREANLDEDWKRKYAVL